MPNRSEFVALCLVICGGAVIATAKAPASAPTSAPAFMPTSQPTAINWDEAKDHIGQTVIVTGPVVGKHDFGEAAVLNVGKDFPHMDRLTVHIAAESRSGIPDDMYVGKTISVTGKLKLYKKLPEIEGDAAHITVADDGGATTAPTAPTSQPATSIPPKSPFSN